MTSRFLNSEQEIPKIDNLKEPSSKTASLKSCFQRVQVTKKGSQNAILHGNYTITQDKKRSRSPFMKNMQRPQTQQMNVKLGLEMVRNTSSEKFVEVHQQKYDDLSATIERKESQMKAIQRDL